MINFDLMSHQSFYVFYEDIQTRSFKSNYLVGEIGIITKSKILNFRFDEIIRLRN